MAFSINSTLEKMQSKDKDFRFMATADLVTELEKDTFRMDADSEKKITQSVLKLLEDSSNQVQEIAVKCLGPLSKKVKDAQVNEIVDRLYDHLISQKKGADELREVASIGVKTIVTETPLENTNLVNIIVKRFTPKLITAIHDYENQQEIILPCLEALNELLNRFGSSMTSEHERILKVIQPQLNSKRAVARKRAILCLGQLAVTIPDNLFSDLVNSLVKDIKSSSDNSEKLRTSIQAISAIARSVGYRLGKFLFEICPIILQYAENSKYDGDDDLKENCFQCFELLILRCPKEVNPFFVKINELCLHYIKYDPNYVADDDEEEGVEPMDEEEEEEEGNDEQEDIQQEDISDDDDMSWKVRRSAAKCLGAIIVTRPDLLEDLYSKVAPELISRLKEREENVRLDVFTSFSTLLKQTQSVLKRNPLYSSTITAPLKELLPKIINSLSSQLKDKRTSVKGRSAVFGVLKELVTVLQGGLENQVGALVPGIQLALGDKHTNANLKIEALQFVNILFTTHPPTVFHSHIKVLAPPIFKAIKDPYYRISAEALQVGSSLVLILNPKLSFDYKPFVEPLFSATLEKLQAQDIDQEVKENAINCMGMIIAYLGNDIKNKLLDVLNLLLDRLTNEITRLTTVKALETIALSDLHIDLSPIIGPSMKELSTFLRKTNRQLKQSSLSTLTALLITYGTAKTVPQQLNGILTELVPLINDSDLHITHLSLHLTTTILKVHPNSVSIISGDIFNKSMELLKSSLLQGLALHSLLELLQELVKLNSPKFDFDYLLETLVNLSKGMESQRHVLSNVAKGIAAILVSTTYEKRETTVDNFIKSINNAELTPPRRHLALYSIGEIGRLVDLSSHANLEQSLLASFESPNEETRQAASFALGNVAVGSMTQYMPKIIDQIKNNAKVRYLLLHSLREIIVRLSSSVENVSTLRQYQSSLIPLLNQFCENEEEGIRNVVAECLGKFALISPQDLLATFLERIKHGSAEIRATIITALKFSIVEKPQEIDHLLKPVMPQFLDLLKDQDLTVRRNTLLTLNYAAHNKPSLIREYLPSYLPLLYGESKVKPELIRQVDLGPFKHKVDDGLEIRKAAYETMYTLLDTCVDRVDIPAFVSNLVDALKDQYDIKVLATLMLIRLSSVAGPALLEGLDQLVEPLRTVVTSKAKEGAVKQEIERNDELIRGTLRAILALTKIPNIESNHKFEEFLRSTIKTGELGERYAAIKAETEHNEDINK